MPADDVSLRQVAGEQARRHPRTAYRLARRLDLIGAHRAGLRLERAADVVTISSPGGRPFGLHRLDGRDQIANAFRTDGWWAFERPLPDVFARLVRDVDGVIVDVGANTGFYSLLAVSVAATAQVVAYEPFPPAAEILNENLLLNDERRIDLRRIALGREEGTASLHIPDPEHGLVETSASLNHEFRDEGQTTAIDVSVSTLDAELSHRSERVGLLKIDVESTEHDVLLGGEQLVGRDRPIIVLEVLSVGDIDALEAARDRQDYVDIRLRPHDVTVGESVQFDADAWNHLWAPAERLREVIDVCVASGLEISGRAS